MTNKNGARSGLASLTIEPDEDAVSDLRTAWSWLLEEPWKPVLFTAFGDMFFEYRDGCIYWICTGDGSVTRVADNAEQFEGLLRTDKAEIWLLPSLVGALMAEGKVLGLQECYAFTILPIFKECTYTPENVNPISVREHFSLSGELHRKLGQMEDGSTIRIKVID